MTVRTFFPRLDRPARFWRYALATAVSALGIAIRVLLNPLFGFDAPLLISIIAVALAVWYGGLGPGLLAIALSMLGGILLFIPPWGVHASLSDSQVIRLTLFLITGLILTILTEALRRTTAQWRRAEQEQENLVLQERNRMAREIHDTLAQGLTGIIIQLEAAEDMLADDPEEAQRHVHRAQNLARESLSEARHSVQALRPPLLTQRDITFALTHYIEQMTGGAGVQVELAVEGSSPPDLPHDIESNLLRIALEALTNALKHAHSRHIGINLSFLADRVQLCVRDDGEGFVPDVILTGGYGLITMRERTERSGGEFALSSNLGEGTEIRVSIPLHLKQDSLPGVNI